MNPIVLEDCAISRFWSRRREVVDRFRISVSRKPCVVERKGGYFRTRDTRQTCLWGIFGPKDPWWQNFFCWLITSCFTLSRKPCVVEQNGGYFRTRDTRQTCLWDIFGPKDPWWHFFFRWLITSCFILSWKPCTIEQNGGYFRTRDTTQICLWGIFDQKDPWWTIFSLTHHFLFHFISDTVRHRAKRKQ